jgi:phage shock protein A
MRVFERIGRMLRADAHGVMDQLEERSLLLKQHLREAELEVAQKRERLEALDRERTRLAEHAKRLEARVAALDEDVELALKGDDPHLARFAVGRLLPRRESLRELFARAAELEERRNRLAARLEEQEPQLAELRIRVRAALACPRPPPTAELVEHQPVSEEEIDLELLRRRRPNLPGSPRADAETVRESGRGGES